MEQRQNERAGETGDPRENPPASGIAQHDSHMRKFGSDCAWNPTRFAKRDSSWSSGLAGWNEIYGEAYHMGMGVGLCRESNPDHLSRCQLNVTIFWEYCARGMFHSDTPS
ncbi:hypothetical protein PR048_013922 [Dryococelus australis]|uniref:Uncharacterized protein n=1 Tax=Dryococelus australis TaxID=614101 RepID=A0ABQ9HTK5_9NEOP|nr:hypothetical protein PR048_013922 [Dryococelus australis]